MTLVVLARALSHLTMTFADRPRTCRQDACRLAAKVTFWSDRYLLGQCHGGIVLRLTKE